MKKFETTTPPSEANTILRVLEKKAFYGNRFLDQVENLYPSSARGVVPRAAPLLYIQSLLAVIPEELVSPITAIVSRKLVDCSTECPSPFALRQVIADAVLDSQNSSYEKLFEQAKIFFAMPPVDQTIADRWLEKIIYTTVKRIGRERFASISGAEWKLVVSEFILADPTTLQTYAVPKVELVQKKFHNYGALLNHA